MAKEAPSPDLDTEAQYFDAVPRNAQTMNGPRMIGNPCALSMGGFATTLMTLSFSLMGLRGVTVEAIHVGNLCFVASIGLLISAQWEIIRGNTFSYTVLSAYGLFYGGYGAILIPFFGVLEAYGGYTPEYYNAIGFFLLIWGCFNFFFILASFPKNLVYIMMFSTVECCIILDAAAHFTLADGQLPVATDLKKAGGAFAFIGSLMGYYAASHYLCDEDFPIRLPMGDTSKIFGRKTKSL